MPGSLIVDILLVAILVAYLLYGYRTGLVRSVGGMIGIAIGGFAAVLLVPVVTRLVENPGFRTAATLLVVVALVVGGHAIGAALGGLVQRRMKRNGLRRIDRLLGAVLTTIVAALVVSMLATSIGSLGVPVLSQPIASSVVLRAITAITPAPVQSFLAQVRSATVDESLPRIAQALGANPATHTIPNVNTGTAVLNRAAESVVRITGNAFACGQSQSGSGFVVADERVITNAHVVAGVSHPVIDVAGGAALAGTIVYFNPTGDLAVIDVPGLSLRSLPLGATLAPGAHAVSDGFPFGGPFQSLAVGVEQVGTINVQDIYGTHSAPRNVYSLAANVQEGDSGGPLLTLSGKVAGVIFAKGENTNNLGYAITMESVRPLALKAHSLSSTVSSGRCTRG
jgi:S1-C subfamily serine protease